MPAVSTPAGRSGAAKSKEEAEGQQAQASARRDAGGSAGQADAATEHEGVYRGFGRGAQWGSPGRDNHGAWDPVQVSIPSVVIPGGPLEISGQRGSASLCAGPAADSARGTQARL